MENNLITLPASINKTYDIHSNCYKYRLIIYNSKMSKLLLNKKIRAKLVKRGNSFYLYKDNKGNLITPRPKSQNLFMSLKKIIPLDKKFLKKKSKTIRIKLELNPDEWGLVDLDRFLESEEEKELAKKLILLGYKVSPITSNDENKLDKGCADLLLDLKDKKIPIEITTTSPSSRDIKRGINSPHGHQWVKISGRVLPLFLYCLNSKTPCFFIMNKKWKKYKHVRYFTNKLEKFNCFVLLSDFSKDWAKDIANKIHSKLKN